jgi:hypothetical protein
MIRQKEVRLRKKERKKRLSRTAGKATHYIAMMP